MRVFENIDCLVGMREYPDKFFDLAIVDPPYGIGQDWKKSTSRKKKHFNSTYKNEYRPSPEYFKELFRVSMNQIIWGYNYYADLLPVTNKIIVWDKCSNFEKSRKSEGELAWTSISKYPLRIYQHEWDGARKGPENGKTKTIHPHQKPLGLYKWLLKNYAKPGDKILDTHVGSASSLIACEDMGFDYVGFELDADYFKAAQERINVYRSQLKLFA